MQFTVIFIKLKSMSDLLFKEKMEFKVKFVCDSQFTFALDCIPLIMINCARTVA